MKPLEEQSPWEVLGLQPGASAEEVRRAYERLATALAPGALALYSITELDEQRALQQRLREAYLTLMRTFGWEVPTVPELSVPGADSAPEAPPVELAAVLPSADSQAGESALEAATEFSGAQLRKVREGLGLTLAEVAQRTRIRPKQLESIEAEAFDKLPQRVFVRGFVMTYARELKLDPDLVWASYGKRWERATARG
ncbi:MAG TPA: helix-turn-helix domain-containing protein [Thermoanaerobaculaceae bacterium]|nr:helix-turn-helix domain-containing protein [Thermoanaerobaculaceae bacterium]